MGFCPHLNGKICTKCGKDMRSKSKSDADLAREGDGSYRKKLLGGYKEKKKK